MRAFRRSADASVRATAALFARLRAQNVPAIDYGLAVAGPLHGHIAMNFVRARVCFASLCVAQCPRTLADCVAVPSVLSLHAQVITDYVPVAGRMVTRAGLLGLSVASVAGLMKLNHEGPGITATLRKLWKA